MTIDTKAIRAAAEAAIKKYGGYPVTDPAFVIALLDRLEAAEKALAEPVVEPKNCIPHGWVINWPSPNGGTRPVYHPSSIQPKFGDMKPSMYPVFTSPTPPAEVDTVKTVCVPPLTDEEIAIAIKGAGNGGMLRRDGSTSQRIARAVEALVLQKARLQ